MTNKGILTYFSMMFMIIIPKGIEHLVIDGDDSFVFYQILFFLFSIPMIDYVLKAYYKVYRNQTTEISGVGSILNKIFLGIPFLLYGNIALVMMVLSRQGVYLEEEKWGVYLLGGLSLGMVPLAIFLISGPIIAVVSYGLRDSDLIMDQTIIPALGILVTAIATKGVMLYLIFVGMILIRVSLTVMRWNEETRIKIYEIIVIVIYSIVLLSIGNGWHLWVSTGITGFSLYYILDIIFIDLMNSRRNPKKVNELYEFLETRKEANG